MIDILFRVGGVKVDKRKELVKELLKDRSMTQEELVKELEKIDGKISLHTAYLEILQLRKKFPEEFLIEDYAGTKRWSLRSKTFPR